MASQFLPQSVKSAIEVQQDKDPKMRKQKRLNQLQRFILEAYNKKNYQSDEEKERDKNLFGDESDKTALYMANPLEFIKNKLQILEPVEENEELDLENEEASPEQIKHVVENKNEIKAD